MNLQQNAVNLDNSWFFHGIASFFQLRQVLNIACQNDRTKTF